MGSPLAYSIVPSLPKKLLKTDNFEQLYSFYSETSSREAIPAFVYFARSDAASLTRVEKIVRNGLQSQNSREVSCSVTALLKWRELDGTKIVKKLISRLIYLIEVGKHVGLPSLLWAANQMYGKGWLANDEIDALVDCLPKVFDDSDYHHFSYAHRESISISIVRTECVVLAKALLQETLNDGLHQMIESAKNDALPEVRFAAL